jgi:UDP:flavonoid glycosyltransferase YjiC (YdhE family)
VADTMPGFDMAAWIRSQPEFANHGRGQGAPRPTGVAGAFTFLAKHSDIRTDGVVRVATEWKPDLLVQSHVDGAGLVAAAKLGIPLVNHGFGFSRIGADEYAKLFQEHMADAFDRHGVTATPSLDAMIQVAPPSMTGDTSIGWPMRYVPFNGGGQRPEWLPFEPDRPRIAVTLGSVSGKSGGYSVVRRVIAAAEGLGVELVLALGDEVDSATLGALPPYVHVAGWMPLNVLLPSCAALVHHGGAGTTLTALDAGVAQLIVPSGADRYINADAVAARGVGVSCLDGAVEPAMLDRLLHDDGLRAAATAVRAEMRAMPSPVSLVPALEELAGAARPR